MNTMKDYRCPHCQKLPINMTDRAGNDANPRKDDYAVCGKCYSINIFDEKNGNITLRSTNDSELSLFMLSEPSLYSRLMYKRRENEGT